MTILYETHIKEKGYAPQAERSGHEYLRGKVRCAPADAAGQGGNLRAGTCRIDRFSTNHTFQLGIGHKRTAAFCLPNSCGSLWNQSPNATPRSLKKEFPRKSRLSGYPLLQYPESRDIMSHVTSGHPALTNRLNQLLNRVSIVARRNIEGSAGSFRINT